MLIQAALFLVFEMNFVAAFCVFGFLEKSYLQHRISR